jgi:trans-aconitate 2-methyltransferase
MKWDAKQYLKFEAERTQPARDLAARVALEEECRKALDIGCGPGNSTRMVKQRFPEADVLGIDQSPEMIRAAREENPALSFQVFDVTRDFTPLGTDYDLVFSNACLQWVPGHEQLLPRLIGLLRPGGILAVQLPNNFEEPVHRIAERVAAKAEWRARFPEQRVFYQLTPEQYFDLLSASAGDFTMWETVYYHRLPSHQAILEWYRGTGLRPYLSCLTKEDQRLFEQEVLDGIARAYPVRQNGEVIFRFPRLFFTARR